MGEDASDGRITLRRRIGRRPKLVVEWDSARTQPLFDRMETEFRRISAELGGTYVRSPFYTFLGRQITVHPLGGAALSDSPASGVINPHGEVWGYPGLYVADGAAIPRALGPNPALTISALAERTAEGIVRAAG
jgi:cholesterol oxidase